MKTRVILLLLFAVAGLIGSNVTLAQALVEGKNPAGSAATQNPVIVGGKGTTGQSVALKLNDDGTLSLTLDAVTFAAPQHVIVDSASSMDVTGTFWQTTQPVSLDDGADVSLGAKADSAASSDTGTFSFIALFKRSLQSLTTLITNTTTFVTSGGGGYIRQDSTATMAKESGGNLATIVTNTGRQGAANNTISQVTATTTSGTLAVARATRRSVTLNNTSPTITVYYGPGTVTSANGFTLAPGQSISKTWVGAINVLSASSTAVVDVDDEYD